MSSTLRPRWAFILVCSLLASFLVSCGGDGGTGPGTEPWTVTSISVSPSTATLEVNETVQLNASIQATGSPAGSTSWVSSNSAVATVTGGGLVTGVAPGQANILATAGGRSASASITVEAGTPDRPGNPTAEAASHEAVDLSWSDQSDDETEFRIERDPDGSSAAATPGGPAAVYGQVATVDAGVTSFQDTELEAGTTYRYRILACNENGCSEPSEEAEVTTDAELAIVTTSLPTAGVGDDYEEEIQVTGGGGTLTWSVIAGELPPGLSLDESTGILSGTPTTEGSYDVTVQVAARGQTTSVELTIVVDTFGLVSLVVFQDDDRDGVHDAEEAGVESVSVTFVDPGDESPIESTASDVDGMVEISLPVGTYGVRADPVPGLVGDPLVVTGLEVEVTNPGPTAVLVPFIPGVQGEIDATGGVLEGPGGATLTVPAEALEEATTLIFLAVDVLVDGEMYPGVELYPEGLELALPVEVLLPLGADAQEGGQFFYLLGESDDGLWQPTVVDAGDETGTFWTGHFSSFFFDPLWGTEGALMDAGDYEWSLASLPSRLAGSGSADEAEEDVARGVGRWGPPLDELDIDLARNDAAANPILTLDVMDLGPCGPDEDPQGRNDRLGRISRNRVLYLNDACLWSTSQQLTGDDDATVSLEGAVVHHVGHLLGLSHYMPEMCEPAGGAALEACQGPPTLSVVGSGGVGPLWPEDLGLLQEAHGLEGDWPAMGVAGLEPTEDWVDEQELDNRTLLDPPPGVFVFDQDGDPVPGATVLFQPLQGDPNLNGTVVVTGPDGIARLESWRTGRNPGTEMVGASFFLPPVRTSDNDDHDALERFRATILPPLVEDFFPLQMGSFFRYAYTRVPVGEGETTTGEGVDEVVGVTQEGDVTWYEMDGDGPVGERCADGMCELGLDVVVGRAPLRVTLPTTGDPLVILTHLLREPIEQGRSWSDALFGGLVTFDWTIESVGTTLTVQGETYQDVVRVRGTVSGQTGQADFYLAPDVGIIYVVASDDEATTTFELIDYGVS